MSAGPYRRFARVASIIAFLGGCAHHPTLKPAPGAQLVPGEQDTAVAETAGVRVLVSGEPWKGRPSDLADAVTPVRVKIENHSGGPIDVQYRDLSLTTPSGLSAHAISPFQIQRPGVVVEAPYYPFSGFYVAPRFAPFYPGLSPWAGPFDFDPGYYDTYQMQQSLPSGDMLAKAMPEGVLRDGGTVGGYLYFQRVQPDVPQVTLTMTVKNPDTNAELGSISIPLAVR